MATNKELALQILQNKTGYAIEGGGVLGIAHAGALVRLYELGGFNKIEHTVGTSVGSIVSIALSLGATSYYIKQKILELDLTKFKDGGGLFSRIYRLFTKYGLHKGDYVEEFVSNVIQDLSGNPNLTFKEAYDLTEVHLTLPYLSLKEKRTKYADHILTPDLKLKIAARWSSTIPYFFQANKKYIDNKLVDVIIDGGVLDNYPLHVLSEQNCHNRDIIGFKLCDNTESNQYKPIPEDSTDNVPGNIFDYTGNFLDILYQKLLGSHVSKDQWKLTCKIDIGKYKSTDFDLSLDDKLWLYNSGRKAVDDHLLEIEEMLNKNEYPL